MAGTELVAVTGASGHIGNVVCRRLLGDGRTVRAIYHRDRRALEGLDLEQVSADLRFADEAEAAVAGASHVIHCAGEISLGNEGQVFEVNSSCLANVLAAGSRHRIRRLVYFSSIQALDTVEGGGEVGEGTRASPDRRWHYNNSKIAGEEAVLRAVSEEGLDAVIVRPTAVIGPYDFKPSLSGSTFRALLEGRLPALPRAGFDWVDVRDVAEAAIALLEKGEAGGSYLLSGRWATFHEIVDLLHAARPFRRPLLYLPLPFLRFCVPFASAYARLSSAAPILSPFSVETFRAAPLRVRHDKATRDLGYAPRPLEETVRDIAFDLRGGP